MIERETTHVHLYEGTACDVPARKLVDLIPWLQTKLEEAPTEYREQVEVMLESDWDSSTVDVDIFFTRPETDEEMLARERRAKDMADARERRERDQLAQLLKKYGPWL
jgi:hypothetical protein